MSGSPTSTSVMHRVGAKENWHCTLSNTAYGPGVAWDCSVSLDEMEALVRGVLVNQGEANRRM